MGASDDRSARSRVETTMRAVPERRGRNGGWAARAVASMVAAIALVATGTTTTAAAAGTTTTAAAAGTTTTAAAAVPATVPAEYQSLYAGLSSQLDHYQAAVAAMPVLSTRRSAPLVRGAELLDANANRGTALLEPGVMADISRDIVHFRAIGVTGLTLGIKLPFLLPAYTGADAARYVSFYRTVARMIRAHGMTVDVELSAAFCGTAYSSCHYHFPSTVAGLARITAQQARVVIAQVRPDYLTLISEDTTDARLTGDPGLDTVAGSSRFVSLVLAALGPRHGVAVGAGAATWEPTAFNRALLNLPIDYLDLHLYPIGPAEVRALIQDTEMAHAAHKPLVADEVWLYKTLTPSVSPNATAVSALNDFSVFAPLDQRFASITQQWAVKAGVRYDSAFWSWQLFGYQTWTPELGSAGYRQLSLVADTTAIADMVDGRVTGTGRAWVGR